MRGRDLRIVANIGPEATRSLRVPAPQDAAKLYHVQSVQLAHLKIQSMISSLLMRIDHQTRDSGLFKHHDSQQVRSHQGQSLSYAIYAKILPDDLL